MRTLLASALILISTVAAAQQRTNPGSAQQRLSRNTIIENARYFSANGQFCLVMGQFENVLAFKGLRADRVFRFPLTESTIPAGDSWVFTQPNRGYYASGPAFPARTATLYKQRRRVAKIELGFSWRGGDVLVSDSGRYIALLPPNVSFNNERSHAVCIYRTDSSTHNCLLPEQVFSPNDLLERAHYRLTASIREDDESGRDLLRLTNPPSSAITIDLATGLRLGEMRDILPQPRTWATSAVSTLPAATSGNLTCTEGTTVPKDSIALESGQLVALAIHNPTPEYPRVARLVRQQGVVTVEVIVSESGQVLCSRSSNGPFGLSVAAEEAARSWRFSPYFLNAKPVKVRSVIEFHFERETPRAVP